MSQDVSSQTASTPTGRSAAVVVVPTFNEAANVEAVIERTLDVSADISVLVVDDASPDGTADVVEAMAKRYPGRILLKRRTGKLGLGTAYLDGFRIALESGFQFVCEMDADRSHDPRDLARLLQPVVADEADLAIGSRYIGGVRVINWPLARLVLSYGAGVYTRIITGIPIRDVTSGFKCFHRRVLEAIDFSKVKSNGYSFQIEMSYRAWKLGFRIVEVPIVFTERTEGQSKMNRRIVREAARKVWELRLRSMFNSL